MKFKPCLLSYSILWIGFLGSRPQCVNAETLSSAALDPASTTQSQDIAQADRPSSRQFPVEGDRAASSALWTSNIAPAEFILPRIMASAPKAPASDLDFGSNCFAVPQRGNCFAYKHSRSISKELSRLADQQGQQIVEPQETLPSPPESPEIFPVPPLNSDEFPQEPLSPENDQDDQEGDAAQTTDPELGRLRLRERPQARERSPQSVFLLGRIDYFRSNNILLDDLDPVDDQLITVGASLLAVPSIGPRTWIVASVGSNLARYSDSSELNYGDFQLRLGIRQNLFPRTYGELSWTNQQFFSSDDGNRFLNDHSVRLSLWRRDPLAPRLNLDSFYQLRLSFADPDDRSRLSNTLGAYLSYEILRDLEVGLDYQFILTRFTQQNREDSYHQLTAQLSYSLSRNSRISLYGGFSFGRSSEPGIDFDSSILGISLSTSLSLF